MPRATIPSVLPRTPDIRLPDAQRRNLQLQSTGAHSVHPDFSPTVLEEIYRYPRKRKIVAWLLWLLTGIFGGHRFYLNRTGTGILMLLTGGGGTLWWFIDAFLLTGMIESHNTEQERREQAGLPPVELDFMPAVHEAKDLAARPEWAARRSGRARLAGDALVLFIAGTALGGMSASEGNFEGLTAVVLIIATTVFGARWGKLARLPVFRELIRWSHRLRLYYFANDPGGPLSLLLRPLIGPVTALFNKRAWAEVRLYLQLGAVFAIVFTLFDLVEAGVLSWGGVEPALNLLAQDLILTLITVYAFATPIGAILTTHVLLERTDRLVWSLSGLSVGAIVLGLFAAVA